MKIAEFLRTISEFLRKIMAEFESDIIRAHIVVSIYLFTADGKLVVLKRSPKDLGQYLFEVPGGGFDKEKDRDLIDAVRRELLEETGLVDDITIFDRLGPFEKQPIMQRFLFFFQRPAVRLVFRFAGLINRKSEEVKKMIVISDDHEDFAVVGLTAGKQDGISFSDLPPEKQSIAHSAYAVVFGSHPMH
ncbi:NUDIX domain-containing protein [Shimazuella alba]|uniref:NUDIX domain-containing protein n=1 Tax=Shimazuella alba TaxID=2690964 RepID=A0A6I4VQ45_9BACL|nr:NUDIX domain-containing protein [Shimazuella alba]